MGLYENIRRETVSRLSLREPVVVREDATLGDTIMEMRQSNLGCVIVVNDDNEPLGLFSEWKLTQLLSQGRPKLDEQICDHIDRDWPRIRLSDPISLALQYLESKNIRFLIVIDDQNKLAGLTGQKGLMEYVADHFPKQVNVQRIGGKPYPASREGA